MTDPTPTPTPTPERADAENDLQLDLPTAASEPVDAFEGVPRALADAIRARGFDQLTSVQHAVLEAAPEDRDLRISSQTGSGKTVAIGLALARSLTDGADAGRRAGTRVLVLVPTRELAMQVREELRWLFAGLRGIETQVLMGGTSLVAERRALARRPAIVVGTPGRVLDHLKGGVFTSDGIEHVVLDESDRMLDMGFREELEAILELLPSERRTHLVSATFPSGVRRLADRFQDGALHIEGTRLGAANVDIEHVAHVLDRREAHAALVNHLLLNGEGRCLVFVERRVDAAELAATLSADGFAVHALSGELPQAQRTRTINAFRNGTVRTLVATDVAARGIDVPEIELVVQYDVPNDADTCVHRSGRTGRAGRTGRNVMFVPPRARSRLQRMLGAARIECTWTAAPSAARVQKELRKRFRHGIHERLRDGDAAPQQQLDFAKRLLDGRDPAEVVAVLLELAQRKPTCEPMEIRQTAAAPPPQRGSESPQGFVRFTINWGASSGAATNRLLSHVCRRGAIRSNLIGTIELGEHESWFDVDASVADRFEKRASRPDRREPRLRISRVGAMGAKPPARRKRKHVPPTGSHPHGRKTRPRTRTPRSS